MELLQSFADLDIDKLFAIARRVVSDDTVEEVHEFTNLVHLAADLVVKSAMRIVLGESPRNLEDVSRVNQIISAYQKDM